MKFSWNEQKAKNNIIKHKVSFEEAKTAFDDDFGRVIYDPDHSNDEDRFILLGMSCSMKVLIVCHCYRQNDEEIRLISARKATKNETKQYKRYRK